MKSFGLFFQARWNNSTVAACVVTRVERNPRGRENVERFVVKEHVTGFYFLVLGIGRAGSYFNERNARLQIPFLADGEGGGNVVDQAAVAVFFDGGRNSGR